MSGVMFVVLVFIMISKFHVLLLFYIVRSVQGWHLVCLLLLLLFLTRTEHAQMAVVSHGTSDVNAVLISSLDIQKSTIKC